MSPAPATSGPLADHLYEQLEPLARDDEANGWALLHYVSGLCAPLEELAALVRDSDDGPGWSALLDVDRCPTWALGWLAQFAGVRLLPQRPDETLEDWAASMRERITRADGRWRGTPDAIVVSVQRTLEGDRFVQLVERYGGDPYTLLFRTIDTETPSAAVTYRAALEQKPAGIVLLYEAILAIPTYAIIAGLETDYAGLLDRYYDYDDLRSRVTHGPLIDFADLPGRYATYDALVFDELSYKAVRSLA